MGTTQTVEVGTDISSWCTKCREMREHVIAIVDDNRPKRVTCKTCQGNHLYRPQPPKSRTKSASKKSARAVETMEWEDLMAAADLDKVQPFRITKPFAVGDVMNHKVFGIGIVVKEVDELKIQVSFQDGVRLLACNRKRTGKR